MQTREIEIKAINKSEAYRYMGFRGNEPDEMIKTVVDKSESELLVVMRPRFVYKCFEIENFQIENEENIQLVGTTLKLKGKSIKEHLNECEKAVVMCATLSSDVDRLIRKNEVDNMFGAMVLDAMANAAIEQVCNAAELFIAADYPEYNRTWRFGVGYGDFPLDTQDELLTILDAQKQIGVCANESHILIPRKSVTCVIGLSKKEVSGETSCSQCSFKDKCSVSKEGGSCGGNK